LKNLSGPELSPCEPTKQGKEALFWGCTPIKKYAPDAIITIFQTVSETDFWETQRSDEMKKKAGLLNQGSDLMVS
jgi:hypothetical protein